jgi:hypothetical protein
MFSDMHGQNYTRTILLVTSCTSPVLIPSPVLCSLITISPELYNSMVTESLNNKTGDQRNVINGEVQAGILSCSVIHLILISSCYPTENRFGRSAITWGSRYRNCLGSCALGRKSRVQFAMKSLDFSVDLFLPAPSCPLRLRQPLTEMSTSNLSGYKGRPAQKA